MRTGLALSFVLCVMSCMAQWPPRHSHGPADSADESGDRQRGFPSRSHTCVLRAIGRPHTAHRIDAAEIRSIGVKAAASDIDGVDFNRYFQWEDSGVIPLEIDFPPMHESSTVQVGLTTVYGEVTTATTPLNHGRARTK